MKQQRSHPLGVPSGELDEAQVQQSTVNSLDRWIVRRLYDVLAEARIDFALWDDEVVTGPVGESVGRITIRDRKTLWSLLVTPELGFGDAYSTGQLEIRGDLVDVLYRAFSAMEAANDAVTFKRSIFGRLPNADSNTYTGSKKHISHHYDLGNDFYKLWLDEEMVYTCAYYPTPDATLEQAQVSKMHHVAKKVELQPGQTVVEAGCGWGSLALHMARHYGVKVKAFNISEEQVSYARARAKREGLDGDVEFIKDDYRNISGEYDAFVSVGMLEHVGVENFKELGNVIARSLKRGGRGLIHSVGRGRSMPPNEWLEKRIFPGSRPPSLREMMDIFEPHQFSIMDVENLRLHYAKTLMEWLKRFDNSLDTVRQTYDEGFIRAWRLYLAGCAAAFMSSSIHLFQVVFSFPRDNDIPLTREHIYTGGKSTTWGLR